MNIFATAPLKHSNIAFGASISSDNEFYSLKEQVDAIKSCADTALKCDSFIRSDELNNIINYDIPIQDTFTVTALKDTYDGPVVSIKYDSYDYDGYERSAADYNEDGFRRELEINPDDFDSDEGIKEKIQNWVKDIANFWNSEAGSSALNDDLDRESARRCYDDNIAHGRAFEQGFLYLDEFDYPGHKW